ncbi:MAG TPA: MarR family winged helix-turn-helix transcriptional regulator, partial [Sphingobium sp.]
GIKRANMVPLISALATRGYIEKSPVDGRSLALSLTAQGERVRQAVENVMDVHESRFERLLAGADESALRQSLALIAEGPGSDHIGHGAKPGLADGLD